MYEVDSNNKININATGTERIIQNVSNILSTIQGELVLNRAFGINGDIVDTPLSKTVNMVSIKKQIEKYESRAEVKGIEFVPNHHNGTLGIKVKVSISE